MKRLLKLILCYTLISQCFLMTVFAKPDWPSDTGIMAEGGIVVDMDSGAVLFGQNIHLTYPPASITKLLTALIVLENCQLDETVTFSDDAVNNVEEGSGNKLNIQVGDTMSVKDCLYSLLLVSCNQAGNALAEHVAGSRGAFVQMMNDRIAQIGCVESRFANPSGLNDANQYVSPYDMALISREAFSNEMLMEIASATSYKISPTINNPEGVSITMEHRLLITTDETSPYYYPAAKAGKTGYTSLAGNTLVTYAEKDGRRLVSVILKGSPSQYFVDGKTLLEFGFSRFKNLSISDNETEYVTGDSPVIINEASYAPTDLILDTGAVVTLPNDAAFADAEKSLVTELPSGAPEDAVALLQYTYNDRKIGQAYLRLKNQAAAAGTQSGEDNCSQAEAEGTDRTAETDETGETNGTEETNGTGETDGSGEIIPPSSQSDSSADLAGKSLIKLNRALILPLVLVLLASAIIIYLIYSGKKEARQMAQRRERRRQRLMEDHISSEEFERLMEERHQRASSRSYEQEDSRPSGEAFSQDQEEKEIDQPEILDHDTSDDIFEIDPFEVDRSEVDKSEVDPFEVDRSEFDRSEVNMADDEILEDNDLK